MVTVILRWEDACCVDVSEDAAALAAITNQRVPLNQHVVVPIISLLLLKFSGRLSQQDSWLLTIRRIINIDVIFLGVSQQFVISSVSD